tara:strand:+ start:405995 stop:406510 length:516 start_codon:yes stop_codon:yes gene_type:complete
VIEEFGKRYSVRWRRDKDFEARKAELVMDSSRIFLFKPMTYMNDSGRALGAIIRYFGYRVDSVVIVYDDVNIELGDAKISVSGSSGGHNGIENILAHIGDGFLRFRIGIGPKEPREMAIKDFVLGKFTRNEQTLVNKKMENFQEGLQLLVDSGPVVAMNQINRRTKKGING